MAKRGDISTGDRFFEDNVMDERENEPEKEKERASSSSSSNTNTTSRLADAADAAAAAAGGGGFGGAMQGATKAVPAVNDNDPWWEQVHQQRRGGGHQEEEDDDDDGPYSDDAGQGKEPAPASGRDNFDLYFNPPHANHLRKKFSNNGYCSSSSSSSDSSKPRAVVLPINIPENHYFAVVEGAVRNEAILNGIETGNASFLDDDDDEEEEEEEEEDDDDYDYRNVMLQYNPMPEPSHGRILELLPKKRIQPGEWNITAPYNEKRSYLVHNDFQHVVSKSPAKKKDGFLRHGVDPTPTRIILDKKSDRFPVALAALGLVACPGSGLGSDNGSMQQAVYGACLRQLRRRYKSKNQNGVVLLKSFSHKAGNPSSSVTMPLPGFIMPTNLTNLSEKSYDVVLTVNQKTDTVVAVEFRISTYTYRVDFSNTSIFDSYNSTNNGLGQLLTGEVDPAMQQPQFTQQQEEAQGDHAPSKDSPKRKRQNVQNMSAHDDSPIRQEAKKRKSSSVVCTAHEKTSSGTNGVDSAGSQASPLLPIATDVAHSTVAQVASPPVASKTTTPRPPPFRGPTTNDKIPTATADVIIPHIIRNTTAQMANTTDSLGGQSVTRNGTAEAPRQFHACKENNNDDGNDNSEVAGPVEHDALHDVVEEANKVVNGGCFSGRSWLVPTLMLINLMLVAALLYEKFANGSSMPQPASCLAKEEILVPLFEAGEGYVGMVDIA